MEKSTIAIIGLGTMGQNLALNFAEHNISVSVYNRTSEITNDFLKKNTISKLAGFDSLEKLVASLAMPRIILLMVKANAVDAVLDQLLPLLHTGDTIIDGGNSHFEDTTRRISLCEQKNIFYVGAGISGGEKGARYGPSIMPGGSEQAMPKIMPLLQKIAAKTSDNTPCCEWIGPGGSGHFVKMVHNAIEYVDMQFIAETYWIAKNMCAMTNEQLAEQFKKWNRGVLQSYLVEITAKILAKKDAETGKYLIDEILDKTQQKGTGKWTAQNALDLGVPVPTLSDSVFTRIIASYKEERVATSKLYDKEINTQSQLTMQDLENALYVAKLIGYAQGFSLLYHASTEYGWNLNLKEVASIWRSGCIIRAKLLDDIVQIFENEPKVFNLLATQKISTIITRLEKHLRTVVTSAIVSKIPVQSLSSSIAYLDSYTSANLPANLVQAQRDFFGAHGYEKTGETGKFHTEWE